MLIIRSVGVEEQLAKAAERRYCGWWRIVYITKDLNRSTVREDFCKEVGKYKPAMLQLRFASRAKWGKVNR